MEEQFLELRKYTLFINSLCVFSNLKKDKVIKKYKKLLIYLSNDNIVFDECISIYNDFVFELMNRVDNTCLKKYIIDEVLSDDNAFTRMIDNNLNNSIILNQVKYELKCLEYISNITSYNIKKFIKEKGELTYLEKDILASLISIEDSVAILDTNYNHYDMLKFKILSENNLGESLESIIEFYKKYGTGIFAKYKVFVWEKENNYNQLKGIKSPDPIKLKQLAGYGEQKKIIIENTEQFLNGYKANNILLYGQRGTGKSATVKAIANEYYDKGLRLVEVDKEMLVDFTKIIRILENKNMKFIIFVDDLVFEEGDETYSALKRILEGRVECKSNNIIIYATTNRKHLVKETFTERDNEVHAIDSIEEKLSLCDRFGITVSFYSPNQNEYLEIVDSIAKERKLNVNFNELHSEALKWVRWNNVRSPRTANQFVNWFEAKKN